VPELERKLALPTLYQLKQRVTIHYQLDRLKEKDIAPFIDHRLQAAGSNREDIFTSEAIQRIALYSQGVPRLINILCDNVLQLGYSISQQTISAEMIEEVSQDLGLQNVTLISKEAPATAREKTGAPIESLLSNATQIEEQLTTERIFPFIQPQPPIQLTTSTSATRTKPKRENPSRRTSSWRLAWAGTGLAFALWSFTFLPYGEEPTTPPISSASSNSKIPTLSNQAMTFFGLNEANPERVRQDAANSFPTAKESSTNKPMQRAASLQSKEANQPSPSRESASTSSSQINSEGDNTQRSVSTPEESTHFTSPEPVLIDVASQGNQQETQRLLDAGAKPNVADERGWTALMMATLHGHTSVVRLLLKKGADVNLSNSTGGTALMMAALQGQDNILQLLLENGAGVDTQDAKGWTALMYAACNGYASTVEILLSSGAEVNLKNDEGQTALMYATAKRHREAIHALQNGKAVSSAVN